MFSKNCDFYLNNGLNNYVMISLPANCPTFMSKTRNIVISMPRQSLKNPYYFIILLKAWKVLLYAFFPVVTDACLRTNATSNGLPIIAPNIPLKAEIPTFYAKPIFAPFFLSFSTAHV